MKQTIVHNTHYTINRDTIPATTTLQTVEVNMKCILTETVQSHLQTRTNNKVINDIPPKINAQEQTVPSYTRRTLAQMTANKYPPLIEYHLCEVVSKAARRMGVVSSAKSYLIVCVCLCAISVRMSYPA